MKRARVGIVGASGYSGIEATRLLATHPGVELGFVTSDRWGNDTVRARLDLMGPVGALSYVPVEEAPRLAAECEAVLLCTPAEASAKLVPALWNTQARIIDLSGAFRLQDAASYPTWYNFPHPQPELLAQATYGLPELFRSTIPKARLVANPGCYATAVILSLAPLLKANLVDPGTLVVNAASGVTGAGRKASEDYSFTEIDQDFRAYRLLRHQHTPEILQALAAHVRASPTAEVPALGLTFTAHLLPIKRGILCTTWARPRPGVSPAALQDAFAHAYGNEPLVTLLRSAEEVSVKRVVGTARTLVGLSADSERVLVVTALDNLVKGAAGQAVQNLNLLLGMEETHGLLGARSFHP